MIISKEFYDQCCPSYKKAINELEKNIAKIDENQKDETKGQQIINVILNFSQSNLTPKEYWEHLLNNSYKYLRDPEIWKNRCTEILNKAYFHFYYNKEWNCEGSLDCGDRLIFGYKNKNLKLMDFQKSYYFERAIPFYCITEGDINYPHDCLKIRFREFEQSTTQLPSAKIFKRYEKMMELYPKIKAAENDVETWFKLLFEVDDVSFVKDNVECRLGQDLLNLRLRKLYLTFLKEQGEYKKFLETYSKYCRFFLDDFEMKEKYKEAMIEYGSINLPWDNLFEYEIHKIYNNHADTITNDVNNEKDTDEKQSLNSDVKDFLPLDKSLYSTFYENFVIQNFSFRNPLILYILKNASHRLLRKLFFSCKYFYAKQKTPICYRFQVAYGKRHFKNESLTLESSSNQELFVKNTFITSFIEIQYSFNQGLKKRSKTLNRLKILILAF